MRVLLLSNNWEVAQPLAEFLEAREHLILCEKDINTRRVNADIAVSYCYRHILKPETLAGYSGCVNLHNGYLPYGRGAQPLFFSVVYGEPCGVTVHWMDAGLDTGPIIAQKKTELYDGLTFRQAYEQQHRVLRELFYQHWQYIKDTCGTYHTTKEFEQVKDILGGDGWNCTLEAARRRWRA